VLASQPKHASDRLQTYHPFLDRVESYHISELPGGDFIESIFSHHGPSEKRYEFLCLDQAEAHE
jgi:hypothetical protein